MARGIPSAVRLSASRVGREPGVGGRRTKRQAGAGVNEPATSGSVATGQLHMPMTAERRRHGAQRLDMSESTRHPGQPCIEWLPSRLLRPAASSEVTRPGSGMSFRLIWLWLAARDPSVTWGQRTPSAPERGEGMPARRDQRSTRPATTRAGSTTARRGNGGNGNGRGNNSFWHETVVGIGSRTAR